MYAAIQRYKKVNRSDNAFGEFSKVDVDSIIENKIDKVKWRDVPKSV